eukprot:792990-Karenia_brevis.AAC.1
MFSYGIGNGMNNVRAWLKKALYSAVHTSAEIVQHRAITSGITWLEKALQSAVHKTGEAVQRRAISYHEPMSASH